VALGGSGGVRALGDCSSRRFNGAVVAWLAAPAVSCISVRLLVGSVEVKVKTWTTTSADAVPLLEASSHTSPSYHVWLVLPEDDARHL